MFEFNDQAWLPKSVRREITSYLDFLAKFMGRYLPVSEIIAQVMEREDLDSIIDLCSGASQTAVAIRAGVEEHTGRELTVYMTDKYPADPDLRCADSRVVWDRRSIDARSVPTDLRGIRTLFTSFHHFRGEAAAKVLADAVGKRQAIAIFEHADRGWWVMVKMAVTTPLIVSISLLARKKVAPSTVLLNLVLPIVPLMLAWDGIMSIRRTYSIEEMRCLVESETRAGEFDWWIGRTDSIGKRGKGPVYYLVGAPAAGGNGRVHLKKGGFPDISPGKVAPCGG